MDHRIYSRHILNLPMYVYGGWRCTLLGLSIRGHVLAIFNILPCACVHVIVNTDRVSQILPSRSPGYLICLSRLRVFGMKMSSYGTNNIRLINIGYDKEVST